jgi:hypothetical protein
MTTHPSVTDLHPAGRNRRPEVVAEVVELSESELLIDNAIAAVDFHLQMASHSSREVIDKMVYADTLLDVRLSLQELRAALATVAE